MEKDFAVTILSPGKKLYVGRVVSLVAPCQTGYWGILANHAPLIALIGKGKITLRQEAGGLKEILVESGGFLEAFENNVILLI